MGHEEGRYSMCGLHQTEEGMCYVEGMEKENV